MGIAIAEAMPLGAFVKGEGPKWSYCMSTVLSWVSYHTDLVWAGVLAARPCLLFPISFAYTLVATLYLESLLFSPSRRSCSSSSQRA